MNKIIKNILLYISAFVPMYFLIFLKLLIEIFNKNLTFNVLNTINLITLAILMVFGVVGLLWNLKAKNEKEVVAEITSCTNITDQHFLGYFSLFVFFAIPMDLSLVSAYCVYLCVLCFIGIVYINSSLYYINPLLNILGYNFYDITFDCDGKKEEVKVFSKIKIVPGNVYKIKVKNNHFSFVDRKMD